MKKIKKNAKDALLLSRGPDSTAAIFGAITNGYRPQLITIQNCTSSLNPPDIENGFYEKTKRNWISF